MLPGPAMTGDERDGQDVEAVVHGADKMNADRKVVKHSIAILSTFLVTLVDPAGFLYEVGMSTPSITLFGSVTSPFVRRARMVAIEAGVPVDLVDTATEAGQHKLRATSPVWKVPAALVDGVVIWDSASIIDVLVARAPKEVLRPLPVSALARAVEMNFVHAIDEATLSSIRLFYLSKDGLEATGAFLEKERDRVGNVLSYLDGAIHGTSCTEAQGFGRAELALLTGLDWLRFRNRITLDDYPRLEAFHAAHATRPSFVATSPDAHR